MVSVCVWGGGQNFSLMIGRRQEKCFLNVYTHSLLWQLNCKRVELGNRHVVTIRHKQEIMCGESNCAIRFDLLE